MPAPSRPDFATSSNWVQKIGRGTATSPSFLFGTGELRPELRRFGNSQSPVVIIDEFCGDVERIARLAEGLAPFPDVSSNYYPGVRGMIDESQPEAFAYVQQTCREAAQFIAGAFDVDGFDLLRSSFSMVTKKPSELSPPQRAPHFDSTDQRYYAVLHYLRVPERTGTAFYRHRATGIERVTEENVGTYMQAAQLDGARLAKDSGYIAGSDDFFEQIGAVEGVADRLVIYQGSLLHSGIIPPEMNFSADPREGRLTANIFVRGH